jgi:hypothetical protein
MFIIELDVAVSFFQTNDILCYDNTGKNNV